MAKVTVGSTTAHQRRLERLGRFLVTLVLLERGLSSRELAHRLGISQRSAQRLLADLQELGLALERDHEGTWWLPGGLSEVRKAALEALRRQTPTTTDRKGRRR